MSSSDQGGGVGPARRPPNPAIYQLEKPMTASEAREYLPQEPEDCLSCKLTGTVAMFGLAGYIFFSGGGQLLRRRRQIIKRTGNAKSIRLRMAGISATSLALIGMGVYRFIN